MRLHLNTSHLRCVSSGFKGRRRGLTNLLKLIYSLKEYTSAFRSSTQRENPLTLSHSFNHDKKKSKVVGTIFQLDYLPSSKVLLLEEETLRFIVINTVRDNGMILARWGTYSALFPSCQRLQSFDRLRLTKRACMYSSE